MQRLGEVSEKSLFVIEWSIKDFISLTADDDVDYISPFFSFASESLFLELFPNGRKVDKSEGYIDVYLRRGSTSSPITIEYTLGMKTVEGKLDPERHFTHTYNKMGYGRRKWISRSELLERKSDLLHNSDTLTLVCRMEHPEFKGFSCLNNTRITKRAYCNETFGNEDIQSHLRDCQELPIKSRRCVKDVSLKNWHDHKCEMTDTDGTESRAGCSKDFLEIKVLQDYKELFLKQKECDVIIRVKGQEFSAHKSILTSRSSVFESTFRNDMKEKETGVVDIEDCDSSSFSDFLCFLYCGDTGTLSEENVFNLFTTADKYDVQDLRDICVRFMKENISIDTFCDTITLALQHCESELITVATYFFAKNARKIAKTVQWQKFSADNPTQSNELFIKALDAAAGLNE